MTAEILLEVALKHTKNHQILTPYCFVEVSCFIFVICIQLRILVSGVIEAVIVWLLDLQLPMQSVLITTDVVSSNFDQGEVYNIMW